MALQGVAPASHGISLASAIARTCHCAVWACLRHYTYLNAFRLLQACNMAVGSLPSCCFLILLHTYAMLCEQTGCASLLPFILSPGMPGECPPTSPPPSCTTTFHFALLSCLPPGYGVCGMAHGQWAGNAAGVSGRLGGRAGGRLGMDAGVGRLGGVAWRGGLALHCLHLPATTSQYHILQRTPPWEGLSLTPTHMPFLLPLYHWCLHAPHLLHGLENILPSSGRPLARCGHSHPIEGCADTFLPRLVPPRESSSHTHMPCLRKKICTTTPTLPVYLHLCSYLCHIHSSAASHATSPAFLLPPPSPCLLSIPATFHCTACL